MGHLEQRIDFSNVIDNRCEGCPILLAEEIGNKALALVVCSNKFISVFKDDDIGCKKGYIDPSKLLHVSKLGEDTRM